MRLVKTVTRVTLCPIGGCSLVMITGDNAHTGVHIAEECGIIENDQVHVLLGEVDARDVRDPFCASLACRTHISQERCMAQHVHKGHRD
jgi:magnesium-transporting ATPase (P-type)